MLDPSGSRHGRRELAQTLRELRKASGLSGTRLAARAHISQSKVSRIESGRNLPSVVDVERIVTALTVPPDVARDLLSLAHAANMDYASWRAYARIGIWRKQTEIKELTTASSTVRQFLPAIPSGLIQALEYARAVLTPTVAGKPGRNVERAVAARIAGQESLENESFRFFFLLTEQEVRWQRAGPDTLVSQLCQMIRTAEFPNVELAIISNGTRVEASPLNVFVVYDDRLVVAHINGRACERSRTAARCAGRRLSCSVWRIPPSTRRRPCFTAPRCCECSPFRWWRRTPSSSAGSTYAPGAGSDAPGNSIRACRPFNRRIGASNAESQAPG